MVTATDVNVSDSALRRFVGAEVFDTVVDYPFLPLALCCGFFAMLLGLALTSCVCAMTQKKVEPKYQTVEAIKLVYDGEEEEATIARNSKKPIPMSVYVNKSSFMDGLRAIPTTSAAKSWPMPCAQPPTAPMAMAQPSTETPAFRLVSGAPRPV